MPRCAPLQPHLNVFLDISYDKLGHISSFPCDIMISSFVGTEQHSESDCSDAVAEPVLVDQFQLQPRTIREEPFSGADDRRTDNI